MINEEMELRQTKEQYKLLAPYCVPHKHVNFETQIAAGSYGEVWLGTCRGEEVAIKRLVNFKTHSDAAAEFRQECNMLAILQQGGLSHENICQMRFCCWEKEFLLLSEYCKLGDLAHVLECEDNHRYLHWKNGDESAGVLSKIAFGAAKAIRFMHSKQPPILHRDIKPLNILVKGEHIQDVDSVQAKVTDFGTSRQFEKDANLSMQGTPMYASPEIVMSEPYDEGVDVYSFGISLCDMVTFHLGGAKKVKWGMVDIASFAL